MHKTFFKSRKSCLGINNLFPSPSLKRPSSKSWRNLLQPLQVKILMNAQGKQKPGAGCAELRKNFVVVSGGHPGGLNLLWVSVEGGVGRVKGFRQGQPPRAVGQPRGISLREEGEAKMESLLFIPSYLRIKKHVVKLVRGRLKLSPIVFPFVIIPKTIEL